MVKRFHDIDIAKGIGIALVVLGHTNTDEGFKKLIYFFHMPLFFVLSGLFFNSKKYSSYKSFFKDNCRSLLLPYVTFFIISYLYWVVFERGMRHGAESVAITTPIVGFFYGTDVNNYFKPNGVLWFLWALFVARTLLFIITKTLKSNYLTAAAIIISAFIGWLLAYFNAPQLPLSINPSFMALFFLGLGYLAKNAYNFIETTRLAYKLIIAVVALFFSVIAVKYNVRINMDYCVYGNVFLFILGAAGGIVLCILLSQLIGANAAIEFYGVNSLIIMGLSEPVKRAVIGLFSKISHHTVEAIRTSVPWSFLCAGVTLIFLIPVIFIFNNYLYAAIGLKKKK